MPKGKKNKSNKGKKHGKQQQQQQQAGKGKHQSKKARKAEARQHAQQSKAERRRARREAAKQRRKKEGQRWASELDQLKDQLRPLALRIRSVRPDGNCCFRSIADQVLGNQNQHASTRTRIVAHMRQPAVRMDLEPFVATEDESYDEYIARMSEDAEWGGNIELRIASDLFETNIVIHQLGQPCWIMHSARAGPGGRHIHLAYSGGSHYDSIRAASDDGSGPAKEISLPAAAGAAARAQTEARREANRAEELCMRCSQCPSVDHVRRVLQRHGNDAKAAMEALIEERNELPDGDWDLYLENVSNEAASEAAAAAAAAQAAAATLWHDSIGAGDNKDAAAGGDGGSGGGGYEAEAEAPIVEVDKNAGFWFRDGAFGGEPGADVEWAPRPEMVERDELRRQRAEAAEKAAAAERIRQAAAAAAAAAGAPLVCGKCDGPHRSEDCPYYKGPVSTKGRMAPSEVQRLLASAAGGNASSSNGGEPTSTSAESGGGDGGKKKKKKKKKVRISRNKPCPCGSGLKYKNCCHPSAAARREARLAAVVGNQNGSDDDDNGSGDDGRSRENNNGSAGDASAATAQLQFVSI